MYHVTNLCTEPDFLEGLHLFNRGEFWHAHEAWERLWLQSTGQQRECVQGLIQCAAALVHWQRGNLRGLQLNWRKAHAKLSSLPAGFENIELDPLIQWMEAMAISAQANPPQLIACTEERL